MAVEPLSSPVLSQGRSGSHKIQGIGAGFVPKVLNRAIIDEVIAVSDEDALATAKLAAKKKACWWAYRRGRRLKRRLSCPKGKKTKAKT